jgi:mannose-6-phosphate isomerase-like protein (cupin superfamily)
MSADRLEVINLEHKFGKFAEHWSPKILAELNDYQIKAVKLLGEFVWHKHDETDELFLVTSGSLVIRFRDRDLRLGPVSCWSCPKAWNTCRSPSRSARCC